MENPITPAMKKLNDWLEANGERMEKNSQKLIKFTQEMEEKQTTFEKLNDMFEWRKEQLKTYKESAKDDIEKTFYIGAMHEAERLQNVLKHMCWTGEITIKFKI